MIEPGPYIWMSKTGDQPVVVVSVLGVGPDERIYVQIEGRRRAFRLTSAVRSTVYRGNQNPNDSFDWVMPILLIILMILMIISSFLMMSGIMGMARFMR